MPDEAANGVGDLDPSRYGVIVRDLSGRRGLLLPDVPGVRDAAAQLAVARRKAGIPETSTVELRRFEVRKFSDGD